MMGSERGMISTKGSRNVGGVTCDTLVAASHHAAWHMSHQADPLRRRHAKAKHK